MANQVLIAHTGQRLQLDFAQLTSLDDFRAIVTRQTSIPPDCIIALTPQSKPLRLAAFQTEKELYVYDARTTQADAAASADLEIPLTKRYTVSNPPNDLRDQRSLVAWQELFQARQTWSSALADEATAKAGAAQERYAEVDAMMRCLDAAVANLEAVVKGVESKYGDMKKWIVSAQSDYSHLVERWEQYLELARSIPISAAMLRFMTGQDMSASAKGKLARLHQASLEDLVDLETARKAGKLAPVALRRFNGKIAELERTAPRLLQGCEEVLRGFEQTVDRSTMAHEGESAQLLQDMQALASKIETDYRTTLEYADSTRDVLQASKIAATHTERLLPSLKKRAMEMDEMFRYATRARNRLATESVDFMRRITELTSLSSEVKAQISGAGDEEDMAHFDYLRLVQQIPYVYASFVSEAIKRREWLDKVKTDSSTLANEMALFHDEEVKRRRKWQKSVGSLAYGPASTAAEHQVAGLEVNLLGEEAEWPAVTRKELEDFYEVLQRQKADADLIDDIGKMLVDLRAPTKQQTKRIKAFKNGSVHEAALGRSGLLIRGDDDVLRSLQEDKTKVENKLRTAESRVRRLEDLLHRQSQASRASIGSGFQPMPGGAFSSDRMDSTGSVKQSRRTSADQRTLEQRTSLDGGTTVVGSSAAATAAATAELRTAQRVQQLESELAAEKERSAALASELAGEKEQSAALRSELAAEKEQSAARSSEQTALAGQMEEANQTKKDLLENLEALKKEFTEERKSLEGEIKRLQARLEDTEDEMEHFGESREHEKATYDEKMAALEAEMERQADEHRSEALKSQGQVEFLRKEAKLQRERSESLEQQLQAAQEAAQAAEEAAQAADEAAQATAGDMARVQADLARSEAAGQRLREEVAAAQEQQTEEAARTARLEGSREEVRQRLAEAEKKAAEAEGKAAEAEGKALETEKKAAEAEKKAAEAEKKTAEAEKKAARLAEEVASKQSHVGSVEEERRMFEEKQREAQGALGQLSSRFEARSQRVRELSQRLSGQNERLCRLLERLGFAVSRSGGSMVIQKVPRAERSALMGEMAATVPTLRKTGQPDPELVSWMNSTDAKTEAERYAAFMAAVGSFDTDGFVETVYRRVKEVEHIARKLQRDVRSYRERAHVLQKEAHDKIAFKHFKEGDLALFLPTRNQTSGAWAAFNIGFPHYFLREQEAHRLQNREWLVARIARVQEKVVDLSRGLGGGSVQGSPNTEADNPFDLSDGLRWYLIDAQEDKPGAPATPGLGKSTVAANNVEAMADIHTHARTGSGRGLGLGLGGRPTGIDGVSKTLSRSLESRRSSTSSRKAVALGGGAGGAGGAASALRGTAVASETNSLRPREPGGTSPPGEAAEATRSADPGTNPGTNPGTDPGTAETRTRTGRLQRETSAASDSPSKRSVVWDSLWDYSYR